MQPVDPMVQVSAAGARLIETSPTMGETGVSVNRETVFRFDSPLATDTVLDTSNLSASAAGRPLLTRVELATDRRSAALFYLEPLPSGTRVTLRLNGFGVLDAAGRALDADSDGLPGGVGEVTFSTVNATAIGNTAAPGRTNNLANGDGLTYLPLAPGDALRAVSSSEAAL